MTKSTAKTTRRVPRTANPRPRIGPAILRGLDQLAKQPPFSTSGPERNDIEKAVRYIRELRIWHRTRRGGRK